MAQYALAAGLFTAPGGTKPIDKQIGQTYHIGLSNGTQFYGYMLMPDSGQGGGWHERSDTRIKDQMIQLSSPNLIDRDLATWPRVSQGDWSGGMQQVVFIDSARYWDSDLETMVPGYLQLRPQWGRASVATTGPQVPQIVATQSAAGVNAGAVYFTFGEAAGRFYGFATSGLVTTFNTSGGRVASYLDTDGNSLFTANSTTIDQYQATGTPGAFVAAVAAAVNGTLNQIWVVQQGTNGYFLYYSNTANALYKIDLTAAFPVAAANHVQIPFGGNVHTITDLVAYQNGIAILTNDVVGGGSDVWFFDGASTTRIVRMDGYQTSGLCNSLGNLFVGAQTYTGRLAVVLIQLTAGSFQVVANLGTPSLNSSTCQQPRASGQYVFLPLGLANVRSVTTTGYILRYSTATGAYDHFASPGASDFSSGNGIRNLALEGLTLYRPVQTGSFIESTSLLSSPAYQNSGALVTSRFDFNSPGIQKRFRRIEATHSPLPANTSLKVQLYTDLDPTAWTSGLTDNGTVTNSTLNSTKTTLVPDQQIGKSAYLAFTLATSDNVSTPTINWFTIEATTPFAWEFWLDCTAKRNTLNQTEDQQGVLGKDLAYLLRNAWETPSTLTLYLPNGDTPTVEIDSFERWNPSPKKQDNVKEEESIVHVVLRQTA